MFKIDDFGDTDPLLLQRRKAARKKCLVRERRHIPCIVKKVVQKKQTLNPSLPKQIKTSLVLEREVLIAQKNNEIDELQKSIQEDRGTADEENEDQAIKERARERKIENKERIDDLENEREELEEGT